VSFLQKKKKKSGKNPGKPGKINQKVYFGHYSCIPKLAY
jgi:hypothetical protein